MASVYTNDLRLEEIGSGEQSGSWGDTTNTNLELIAEAFSFGTEAITTNANTHATTIADGATDAGRSMFLKYTGTLDSACTITIGPNTVSKLWFIENGTSGSQNIIIKQGSGATITIAAGQTKAIYSNGAGSGGAMVDAFAALSVVDLIVSDDLIVGDDLGVTGLVTIGETLAVTGVLTTTAATVFNGGFVSNDGSTITTADNTDTLTLQSTDADAVVGPVLSLKRDSSSPADNDALAYIKFVGENDAGEEVQYVYMQANALDVTDGTEDGKLEILSQVAGAGVSRIKIDSTEIAFNDSSVDLDFRVETNGVTDAFLINGGTDSVHIGTGVDFVTNTAGNGQNVRVGVDAGSSIASGGNQNVLLGDGAGATVSTGDGNIAIGFEAGNDISTGGYNTLIGWKAGDKISTGSQNTGIGDGAISADTLGKKSVGVGSNALNTQNFTSATDAYNVAMGYNAGAAVTTGTNNTLIGGLAGDAITTAANNTAVGLSALTAATTSHSNTAIGVQALQGLTTTSNSNFSTAVGFQAAYTTTHNVDAFGSKALYSNTTALYCCAFGRDSLTTNTTGNNNSGFGYRALRLNTTGADNTAVGYSALTSCTTGVRNVAMGKSALVAMTTGYDNTFIGEKAGEVLTTGFHNTAIGQYALSAGQSMEKNVAIGAFAGFTVTGDQNTFLGTNAGYNNVTSGDNNTMVGYYALSSGATVSNEFTLGNSSTDNLRCADTSISSLSDERDKKNIVDVPLGLDFIKTLRPVSFDWNARDGSRVGKKDFGFVAQELKTAGDATDYADHMRLVGTGELNLDSGKVEMLEADPMKTYPVLVKAVQELSTALNAALARIATLEG